MLESLGLSMASERVYRAMLAHPTWGVDQLSVHTGLSTEEVHDALDELAEMALLGPSADSAHPLRPADPAVGLAALLARAEAEVLQRTQQIEATRAAIAAIAAAHELGRHQDVLIRLEGVEAVRARLVELAMTARSECLSFSPGAAHSVAAMEASQPLNAKALERGVAIRAIYQDSFRNDTGTLGYARWLVGRGGQTRTLPIVPMQLVIVDRERALLPIDPSEPKRGAVEVRSSGLMAALCALFEQLWATATPFGQAATVDQHGLTPTERELLTLLGDGHTDESAGRKLGLSARTVQRMMAELSARLGAQSRFQAGVTAVRKGWL